MCDADPEIKHTLHRAFLSHVQYACEGQADAQMSFTSSAYKHHLSHRPEPQEQ